MTTLKQVYAEAWRKHRGLGEGWIVNLEPTYNLALGAVGVVEGDEFRPETTLEQRGVGPLATDGAASDGAPEPLPWQFQSNDGITVSTEVGATTPAAGGVVGSAALSASISFGSSQGVSIFGTSRWWNGYSDLGVVRREIVAAARAGQLHEGESIVVSQEITGAGVVFTSKGKNASIEVSGSADVAPGGAPSIASLHAGLRVERASGGADYQSFADGSVLAARLLYLGRRGFFWWRDFVAFGAVASHDARVQVEETLIEPVEGDGDDQYVALLGS